MSELQVCLCITNLVNVLSVDVDAKCINNQICFQDFADFVFRLHPSAGHVKCGKNGLHRREHGLVVKVLICGNQDSKDFEINLGLVHLRHDRVFHIGRQHILVDIGHVAFHSHYLLPCCPSRLQTFDGPTMFLCEVSVHCIPS